MGQRGREGTEGKGVIERGAEGKGGDRGEGREQRGREGLRGRQRWEGQRGREGLRGGAEGKGGDRGEVTHNSEPQLYYSRIEILVITLFLQSVLAKLRRQHI